MEEMRNDRLENVPPCLLRRPHNDRLEKKRRRQDLNQEEERNEREENTVF